MTGTAPTIAGTLLRGYVSVLERRGLLPSIRERVSERAREAIDHPPLPIAWVESRLLEEMMVAVGNLIGREATKEIALETARTKAGPLVLPFMRTLLALWGATPESLFKHGQRLIGVQAKGISVAYAPETPSSGTVELGYPYATSDSVFASWEGTFQIIFEVCRVKGTVGRSEVFDEGRRARIQVHWGPEH